MVTDAAFCINGSSAQKADFAKPRMTRRLCGTLLPLVKFDRKSASGLNPTKNGRVWEGPECAAKAGFELT